jgi:predicted phosphoribosyltransferase
LRYGETAKQLRQLGDQLEILMLVEQLQFVDMWCSEFNQLEDREVLDLMVAAIPDTPN